MAVYFLLVLPVDTPLMAAVLEVNSPLLRVRYKRAWNTNLNHGCDFRFGFQCPPFREHLWVWRVATAAVRSR